MEKLSSMKQVSGARKVEDHRSVGTVCYLQLSQYNKQPVFFLYDIYLRFHVSSVWKALLLFILQHAELPLQPLRRFPDCQPHQDTASLTSV